MMMPRRQHILADRDPLLSLFGVALLAQRGQAADTLPKQLSDRAFWQRSSIFPSLAGSSVRTISVERNDLPGGHSKLKTSSSYPTAPILGSGRIRISPTQSASSAIAFIIDIRRQNMIEHLLFKAVLEMSTIAPDFLVSPLLSPAASRPRALGGARGPLQRLNDDDRSETLFLKI